MSCVQCETQKVELNAENVSSLKSESFENNDVSSENCLGNVEVKTDKSEESFSNEL